VRRFVFVDEERSYAERTGQSNRDLGWVRVLAFREVGSVSLWDPRGNRRNRIDGDELDLPAPGATRELAPEGQRDMADRSKTQGESFQGAPDANPGTGWGERRHDPVRRTEFHPERQPTDHMVLRYEYAAGLRALGINPRRTRLWDREQGDLGFAQPPRW